MSVAYVVVSISEKFLREERNALFRRMDCMDGEDLVFNIPSSVGGGASWVFMPNGDGAPHQTTIINSTMCGRVGARV